MISFEQKVKRPNARKVLCKGFRGKLGWK